MTSCWDAVPFPGSGELFAPRRTRDVRQNLSSMSPKGDRDMLPAPERGMDDDLFHDIANSASSSRIGSVSNLVPWFDPTGTMTGSGAGENGAAGRYYHNDENSDWGGSLGSSRQSSGAGLRLNRQHSREPKLPWYLSCVCEPRGFGGEVLEFSRRDLDNIMIPAPSAPKIILQ